MGSFFGIIDKLVCFLGSSPKRTSRFGHNLPIPKCHRWLSRDTSIAAIASAQDTIGTVLYDISIDAKERTDMQDATRDLAYRMLTSYAY